MMQKKPGRGTHRKNDEEDCGRREKIKISCLN